MGCRCAPALLTLRDEFNAAWPDRDKSSDGCCGDAAHAARKSDHNPGPDGYAHAYDVDENLNPKDLDAKPLMWLWDRWVRNPDPRIKYLIYERRIWFAATGDILAYTGANAHEHHMHVSIRSDAALDTSPWGIAPVVVTVPKVSEPEGDDVASPTDIVATLDCDTLPGADGLAPFWVVRRNGTVEARNGAPFYGSLPSIGVDRSDVIGMQHRHDRPGYVLVCEELFQVNGEWKSPTFSFPV